MTSFYSFLTYTLDNAKVEWEVIEYQSKVGQTLDILWWKLDTEYLQLLFTIQGWCLGPTSNLGCVVEQCYDVFYLIVMSL